MGEDSFEQRLARVVAQGSKDDRHRGKHVHLELCSYSYDNNISSFRNPNYLQPLCHHSVPVKTLFKLVLLT